MELENSKEYLLKISSKILGPFSEEEISSMIIAQQVSLIDEIKKPLSRWIYIREERNFISVIQKIREQIENSNEITESSGFRRSQDLTPTPTPVVSKTSSKSSRDREYPASHVADVLPPLETVVVPRHKLSFFRNKVLRITSLISIILIGSLLLNKYLFTSVPSPLTSPFITPFKKNEPNFKELRWRGLDRVALKKFGQNSTDDKHKSFALEDMAGLLIAYEGRGPDLKKYLQQRLQAAQTEEERAKYQNFLGIAFLQERKFESSLEHFQKAFEFAPLARSIEINKGLLELTRQNYDEAFRQFRNMMASRLKFDDEQKRIVDLGFLVSFYKLFNVEPSDVRKKQYKKFEADFDRIFLEVDREYFLSFERSFFLYKIKSLFHPENMDLFFNRVLSRLLQPLSQMRRNEVFYWNWLDWDQLSRNCKVNDPSAVQDLLLKVICDLNDHRDEEAEMKLKDLASRSDAHISTLLTLGYFLLRIGRTEEARSQMALAVRSFPKNKVALHLLGTVCLELQDEACAQESFGNLLRLDNLNTDAFLALSKINQKKENQNLQLLEGSLPAMDRLNYFPYLEWKSEGTK